MKWANLFVIQNPRLDGATAMSAPETPGSTGVFLSPQSLVSFPVAASVIGVLWKLATALAPTWGASPFVPFVLALAVGLLVFLITVLDPEARPTSALAWIIAIVIAIINSLFLAAASLGILATASGGATGTPAASLPVLGGTP